MKARSHRNLLVLLPTIAAAAIGCNAIWGIKEGEVVEGNGGQGTGGGPGTGGAGTGGATTGGNGGAQTGGASTGGASLDGGDAAPDVADANQETPPCALGEKEACYTGPSGTLGTGACKAGERTCQPGGAWGTCVGEVLPKPEDCATATDDDCDGRQCGDIVSSWTVGDESDQFINYSTTGPDGTTYAVGGCKGFMDFGGGLTADCGDGASDSDAFVVAIGLDGKVKWVRTLADTGGGTLAQTATGVVVDGDGNVVVTGWYQGIAGWSGQSSSPVFPNAVVDSGYVTSFDKDGVVRWSQTRLGTLGSTTYQPWAVTASASTGWTYWSTGLATQSNASDFQFMRFDKNGTTPTTVGMSSPGVQSITAMAVDATGSVWTVGKFEQSWTPPDGTLLTSKGQLDSFAVKYSSALKPEAQAQFGDTANEIFEAVAPAGGSIVVCGTYNGPFTMGTTSLPAPTVGMNKLLVARLSAEAKPVWADGFGRSTGAFDCRVAVAADGSIYVGGLLSANGTMTYGSVVLQNGADYAAFVLKLTAGGVGVWGKLFPPSSTATKKTAVRGIGLSPDASQILLTGHGGEVRWTQKQQCQLGASKCASDIFFAAIDN